MKNYIYSLLFIFSIGNIQTANSQDGFRFFGNHKGYQDTSFRLINNLIIIPLEINNKKLNFILDTGVNKTIIFNSSQADTVFFRMKKRHQLLGLGRGKPVDAIISENNIFKLDNLISTGHSVYIIVKDEFDLSSKMGTTIHGVIGYDLLRNLILQINYRKRKIRFFDPKTYQHQKCKKCEEFPMTIYQNKPFIDVAVQINDNSETRIPVKMLVDSGGSDALWLFEHTKEKIVTPEIFFNDFLGVGLSGTIYGKRSRIKAVELANYIINEPTVSFLDSISTKNARKYKERNGSIGNNILKRFIVWIDYPNQRLMLKKNGSFKIGFDYNMSGIEVVYNGKILVQEKITSFGERFGRGGTADGSASNSITLVTNYVYRFKPSFRVNEVLKGSPAFIAGVKEDDILIKINGEQVHNYRLEDIIAKFQQKPNKRIRLTILRDGKLIRIEFRLKKIV